MKYAAREGMGVTDKPLPGINATIIGNEALPRIARKGREKMVEDNTGSKKNHAECTNPFDKDARPVYTE